MTRSKSSPRNLSSRAVHSHSHIQLHTRFCDLRILCTNTQENMSNKKIHSLLEFVVESVSVDPRYVNA